MRGADNASSGRRGQLSHVLPVRLSDETHDYVVATAEAQETSAASLVRRAIAAFLPGLSGAATPPLGSLADAGGTSLPGLDSHIEDLATLVIAKLHDRDSLTAPTSHITKALLQISEALRDHTLALQLIAEKRASTPRPANRRTQKPSRNTPNAAGAAGRETRAPSKASRGSDTRRTSRDTKAGKRCRTR